VFLVRQTVNDINHIIDRFRSRAIFPGSSRPSNPEKEGLLCRFDLALVMQRLTNELDAEARKWAIDVAAVREAFLDDLPVVQEDPFDSL
jgi:hypothetical protein